VRLVFDIQSLQNDSRLRGIGRYTHSLISSIVQQDTSHEIVLLLNGSVGEDQDKLIAELESQIPGVQCVVCSLPAPTAAYDPANFLRRSLAELVREAFITELRPDLVHVFSMMEGYGDNVVTSIGRTETHYPTTATFFDLIPLLNPGEYLETNKVFKRHYQAQLAHLKCADGLLAISHFSAGEAAEHLGYPKENVAVALLGPLASPEKAGADTQNVDTLRELGLSPGFLLYVGGSDPRKNLPRLVEAWSTLPGDLQREHALVLVGSMPDQDVLNLKLIAEKKSASPEGLRFPGQISDEALKHLFEHCSAFVFPSWHEGFGLPALEAMAFGAATIAANASSLPEVVGLPEAMFDPFDTADLVAKLERVLTDPEYRQRLRKHATRQAAKFSWQHTADSALAFFDSVVSGTASSRSASDDQPALAPEESHIEWMSSYPKRLERLLDQLATEIANEPKTSCRASLMTEMAVAIERNEEQLLEFANRVSLSSRRRLQRGAWLLDQEQQVRREKHLLLKEQLLQRKYDLLAHQQLLQKQFFTRFELCYEEIQQQLLILKHTFLLETWSSEGAVSPWLIEGPFDTTYSLAILNRELARALSNAGVQVALHSTEGPGDFDPNPQFLRENPDVVELMVASSDKWQPFAVSSRLLFPPRVDDLPLGFGMLHLYGWEEGALPRQWVRDFNTYLGGITTMSHFVTKVLIDNGVTVPVAEVGVGVDHWERITPDSTYKRPADISGFAFLHVSSCFPRKGVDVLLRAWGEAFSDKDDVTLVIKTFPNPHNAVHKMLKSMRETHASFPRVLLIEEDLTDGGLKALMLSCDALVAPSRGEGFGLPIAEAMLAGLPVVTTGYGGQMDFCSEENAWLVDYRFDLAQTHFDLPHSVWVEPSEEDLARQLRSVFDASPSERKSRAALGREHLLMQNSWQHVAARVVDHTREWKAPEKQPQNSIRIGWVSSWNTRCGIAAYSAYLVEQFGSDVRVYASYRTVEEELDKFLLPVDGSEVSRCWFSGLESDLTGLREALLTDLPDAVVIQFNFGFYEFEGLSELISALKRREIVVVVMFHSTFDPPQLPKRQLALLRDGLAQCDRLLVHSVSDLNRLKELTLIENVTLFPHGVISDRTATSRFAPKADKTKFKLASFGFLLPNKGLDELLEAVALLVQAGHGVLLHMLNAEYPAEVSREAALSVRAKVEALGLQEVVKVDTIFYTDEECLERLAQADLVVFPYQETRESSSAAARHAIGSGAPVATTPIDIFDDVLPAVITLPGSEPQLIASGIEGIMAWGTEQWTEYEKRAQAWRACHGHDVVAERLEGMLRALCQRRVLFGLNKGSR